MSNKCEIQRTPEGVRLFLQSPGIEKFFQTLSKGIKNADQFVGTVWQNESSTNDVLRSMTETFMQAFNIAQRNKKANPEDLVIPSFRANCALYQNNLVNVKYLVACGIGEGKTFNIAGLYSQEALTSVGYALKKAMDYILNDASRPFTVTFEVVERPAKSKEQPTEVLEFDE